MIPPSFVPSWLNQLAPSLEPQSAVVCFRAEGSKSRRPSPSTQPLFMTAPSICLDICTAQLEMRVSRGNTGGDSSSTMAHCGSMPLPHLTTPSTQHPVYLPPGAGLLSGAPPRRTTHGHCGTLCLGAPGLGSGHSLEDTFAQHQPLFSNKTSNRFSRRGGRW